MTNPLRATGLMALIVLAVLAMAPACKRQGEGTVTAGQPSPLPSDTLPHDAPPVSVVRAQAVNDKPKVNETSSPADTNDSIDLASARAALVVMVQNSNDPKLMARLSDLSKEPEKGGAMANRPQEYGFHFGSFWIVNLYNSTWNVTVSPSDQYDLRYYGIFVKGANSNWSAEKTSQVQVLGRGSSGGP